MTTAQGKVMICGPTAEGAMAKANLASMSVNALLKLREDTLAEEHGPAGCEKS
jgi:hypothetical protein